MTRRISRSLDAGQWRSLGLMAGFVLGLRHAFDADHIAAIDNTTRKLMAEGKRPMSVGFWFPLGPSSVVFALAFVLALGIKSVSGSVSNAGSRLHDVGGVIGTSASPGRCIRSGCCSSPPAPPARGFRSTRSCAFRSCSPPACRCWTRSTGHS
jgi:high-affinity nickel permease